MNHTEELTDILQSVSVSIDKVFGAGYAVRNPAFTADIAKLQLDFISAKIVNPHLRHCFKQDTVALTSNREMTK